MDALRSIVAFFNAKPGSASNDAKYKAALKEGGLPDNETGVGQ